MLHATTAYTFSTSQLLKVVRTWCVLYILTWKCASRHNGVQFFISHLARLLRTRRFSEITFRPSGATNHWKKHSESWLSYLFAHLHLLSSHFFSSLIFSLLLVSSLTLSTSAFPTVHIVGSFTSKLLSINTCHGAAYPATINACEPTGDCRLALSLVAMNIRILTNQNIKIIWLHVGSNIANLGSPGSIHEKTRINLPFGDDSYHPCIVILGMIYCWV